MPITIVLVEDGDCLCLFAEHVELVRWCLPRLGKRRPSFGPDSCGATIPSEQTMNERSHLNDHHEVLKSKHENRPDVQPVCRN